MKDQVSIIMPAHRAEGFIARAVKSVLAQTYSHWQLCIISDDGMDYRSFLASMGIADVRIRFAHTPAVGSGPNVARNIGLECVSGRYLAPLDADDYFEPERLEKLMPLARRYGVVADNVHVLDQDNNRWLYSPFPVEDEVAQVPLSQLTQLTTPLLLVFDRFLLSSGWNTRVELGEDTLFNLRLVEAAGRLMVHQLPLHTYCIHNQSLCHKPDAAERAYAYCIREMIQANLGFRSQRFREAVMEMLHNKHALNRCYAMLSTLGYGGSFQEFVAGHPDIVSEYYGMAS